MATNTPIPPTIAHLANQFRDTIFLIDLKSTPIIPITDTASATTHESVNHLREIATEMNSAGYLNEYIQIYTQERTSLIDAFLQSLQVQNLSFGSFVKYWCQSVNFCVKYLFLHEKELCHKIFQGLGNASYEDACFVETIKQFPTKLFDSAEALTSSVQPSPENMFRILDIYETLSGLLPLINDLFSSELSESIRVRPAQMLPKLAQLILSILSDFESKVLQIRPQIHPIPEIDQLPRYVMNYVCYMCDYKQTLEALILSKPSSDVTVEFVDYEEQSPLSQHLTLIIMRLVSNLEAKSKLYKEEHFGRIFILKNVDYIVGKLEGSPELQDLIGEGYLKKVSSKLCQIKVDCLRLTFDKMLYCLRVKGLNRGGIFSSRVKKMTKRLNSFNEGFAKAHKYSANLVVPDSQLVVDFRESIREKLVPIYSSFLEQLESVTGTGKHSAAKQQIKYSVQDLETAICNLFVTT